MKSGSSAHTRGCGEERPRRRTHRDQARSTRRRLQPRRDPARGDRDAAGHPLRRGGQRVPPAPAADHRRARDLRRRDGEGDPPGGRQRLRAAGGSGELRTLRDQEHELVHAHRARDRRGGRRQVAVWESGRRGGAAHVRLRRRTGTLTARRTKEEADDYRYFPSPTSSPSSRRRTWSSISARSCRSCPRRGSGGSGPCWTTSGRSCWSRVASTRSGRRRWRRAQTVSPRAT